MNTRWRVRALPMAVGAAALSLTACSPLEQFSAQSDPDAVTLWYWNRSIEPSLFRKYEQEHPGVRINDQVIGGDYGSKLRTVLAGNTFVPDIVAFNDDVATYFRASDHFVNLYDYGAADVQKEYQGWKWQAGVTSDGKMMAFPMDTGPTGMLYRADLFAQAGLPSDPNEVMAQMSTWEDYYAAGQQLQAALPGVHMIDSANEVYTNSLRQSADYYVTRDDVYIGDGPSVQRSWNLAVQSAQLGVVAGINSSTSDWNAALSTSSIASVINGVWIKATVEDAATETSGTWRIAPSPGGAGNRGGSFLGITEASNKKALAFDIIRTVQSPQGQIVNYTELALYPSATAAQADPAVNQPEPFFGGQNTNAVFSKVSQAVPNFYFSPADNVINPAFTDEMTNVALLGKNPNDAWNDAQARVRRELKHKMPWVKLGGS